MEKIFINHTNHPSVYWDKNELQEANAYGKVIDISFPTISPVAETSDIWEMARDNAKRIAELSPVAVLCQGEFTYTYALVTELIKRNICVLAACSERIVEDYLAEDGSIKHISQFRFRRFRHYGCI